MDWNEIKEKYPKLKEIIYEFFGKEFNSKNVNAIDRYIHICIQNSPRILYDFFDHYEINCYTDRNRDIHYTRYGFWKYIVKYGERDMCFSNDDYINRQQAEQAAFLVAFEILEKRLR